MCDKLLAASTASKTASRKRRSLSSFTKLENRKINKMSRKYPSLAILTTTENSKIMKSSDSNLSSFVDQFNESITLYTPGPLNKLCQLPIDVDFQVTKIRATNTSNDRAIIAYLVGLDKMHIIFHNGSGYGFKLIIREIHLACNIDANLGKRVRQSDAQQNAKKPKLGMVPNLEDDYDNKDFMEIDDEEAEILGFGANLTDQDIVKDRDNSQQ